jgi:hypothetical protein
MNEEMKIGIRKKEKRHIKRKKLKKEEADICKKERRIAIRTKERRKAKR